MGEAASGACTSRGSRTRTSVVVRCAPVTCAALAARCAQSWGRVDGCKCARGVFRPRASSRGCAGATLQP
ncbi:hypothetical protein C2S52_001059 [Perilla frutescens var. hirtella]|nr:hypothetical protein C2S52_001059 [Perilla frutescens var. hirtella]